MLRTILAALAVFTASAAYAEDYTIIHKEGGTFEPAELTIPADTKVKVTVKNEAAKPIEFESHDLKREKIINAGSKAVVNLGPLKPGAYGYFDEFNEANAKGVIVVK